MRQFFVDEELKENCAFSFSREQSHHMADVLRLRKGDVIRAVDRNGSVFMVSLDFEGRNVIGVPVERVETAVAKRHVVYAAALIKKENWDWLIQKAAELGADVLVPLNTARSQIRMRKDEEEKKLIRWNRISLEACQQSNRTTIMKVEKPIDLKEIIKYRQELNVVAWENEEGTRLRDVVDGRDICFVIGPEGGFTEEEINCLNETGFVSVSLGNSILRAETAGISILSYLTLTGD